MSQATNTEIKGPKRIVFVYRYAYGKNDGSSPVDAFNQLPKTMQRNARYIVFDPKTGEPEIVKS